MLFESSQLWISALCAMCYVLGAQVHGTLFEVGAAAAGDAMGSGLGFGFRVRVPKSLTHIFHALIYCRAPQFFSGVQVRLFSGFLEVGAAAAWDAGRVGAGRASGGQREARGVHHGGARACARARHQPGHGRDQLLVRAQEAARQAPGARADQGERPLSLHHLHMTRTSSNTAVRIMSCCVFKVLE